MIRLCELSPGTSTFGVMRLLKPRESCCASCGAGAVVGGLIGNIPGVLVGSVAGYGVGDLTHNLLWEPWGQDMHAYGAAGGVLYGIGHSEFATADDTRGFAISAGHEAEHLWDGLF